MSMKNINIVLIQGMCSPQDDLYMYLKFNVNRFFFFLRFSYFKS